MPLGASRASILGNSGFSGSGVHDVFSLQGQPSVTNSVYASNPASFSALSYTTIGVSCWIKIQSFTSLQGTVFHTTRENVHISATSTQKIAVDLSWSTAGILNLATGAILNTDTWYHIYVVIDSTQAVQADRIVLYVNGTPTAFATSFGTPPSQGETLISGVGGDPNWETQTIYRHLSNSSADTYATYQHALFSGTLPPIGDLYIAGTPQSVVDIAGLFSHVDVNAAVGSILDSQLAVTWTTANVTRSIDIPV